MSFMAWFRAWVDDPRSDQRQKECGTWEVSEGKFRKISAKEEKRTDQRQRTEKRKRTKEKLQHAGWKKEKREKTRTNQQQKEKRKNERETP